VSESGEIQSTAEKLRDLLGYFDPAVLSSYRNEPHRYVIQEDDFEGRLEVTSEYYRELDAAGAADESISIRFGYRSLSSGQLALVVWLPDLFEKSKRHIPRWKAFLLPDAGWSSHDERFRKWVRRNLEGSWEIDNGPLHYLAETVKIINGLTTEVVGTQLYKHVPDATLGYPAAENTHRYQDAHEGLYGYLIDGLDKDCISRLAARLNRPSSIGNEKTVQAVLKLFPTLKTGQFEAAASLVSEQRRLAAHSVRPSATDFPAFSQFTADLSLCLAGVRELLSILEHEFGVSGEHAYERSQAMKHLPRIVRGPEPNYSINKAAGLKGKTIEKVEFGFRQEIEGLHNSEAIVLYCTDGSIMSIDTGSNVGDVVRNETKLRPEDFHVDFWIEWVPELSAAPPNKKS
jgi:hypothetical protein